MLDARTVSLTPRACANAAVNPETRSLFPNGRGDRDSRQLIADS